VANQLLQFSTVELNKDRGVADPHMLPTCNVVDRKSASGLVPLPFGYSSLL